MHINIAADGFIRWYARYFGRFVALPIAALYGAISLLYITAHFILLINAWIVAGRSGPIASGKALVSIHENPTLNPARLKENAARSLT
jgi:hypothetical protein